MRESVAVLALIGGIIQLIAAIGGPALNGLGSVTNEPAPDMPTGPLLVGIAIGTFTLVAGILVAQGRRAQLPGLLLIAGSLLGLQVVSRWTGWFTFGAGFAIAAGLLALLVRRDRGGTASNR